MARQLGRLGRLGAGRAGAGARHARAERYDTAGAPTTRPAARPRHGFWGACDTALGSKARRAQHSAHRSTRTRHDTVLRRPRYDRSLAMTRLRPGYDTTARARPCARLGAPVRTWACLLGQLGARAPGSFFFTWFSTQYRF